MLTRMLSSGCRRPSILAAAYWRCTSAAFNLGRLIGSLGSTRLFGAVGRFVPLSASPGSAPMKPPKSFKSTSLDRKFAFRTGRCGLVSTARSPSKSLLPTLPTMSFSFTDPLT